MPIYEYACRACGHRFEALVRKATVPSCPHCLGEELERLLSLPVVNSASTKALSRRAARQRDARQGAERVHTQREYERHHND